MRILGISAFYHDSAAALIENGRVIAAVQEERFTRIKHDQSFPINAINYCIEKASGPIDAFAYYEKPLLKFDRILRTAFATAPLGFNAFCTSIPLWMKKKLWIPMHIEKALKSHGLDAEKNLYFSNHHLSHAASAFFASPFKNAAILTVDGVGEWTTTAMGVGRDNQIHMIKELNFPHSLGLLYSAFTYFCGFRVNSGEYKLMGLAPYGKPIYKNVILEKIIQLKEDGSFKLNMKYFAYLQGEKMTNKHFAELFGGPARAPEAPVTKRECNIASSIQKVCEEILLLMVNHLHKETGQDSLCLAGGVALNCVANGRILNEGPFKNIWIQPASGDSGGALGAALAVNYMHFKEERIPSTNDIMEASYLGPEYSDEEISKVLEEYGISAESFPSDRLNKKIVEHITSGSVIGLFHGRAEYGPRALGNRSIIADPRNRKMQKTLNLKIKFRESFRPFAPIVLEEKAQEYFDLQGNSPYMLLTAPIKEKWRINVERNENAEIMDQLKEVNSLLPAITHVDYSARIQTVNKNTAPMLHSLLLEFYSQSNCPVLVNTSFNVRGEPPVCHPREAIECFLDTEMDYLVLGSYFIGKPTIPTSLIKDRKKREFSPD